VAGHLLGRPTQHGTEAVGNGQWENAHVGLAGEDAGSHLELRMCPALDRIRQPTQSVHVLEQRAALVCALSKPRARASSEPDIPGLTETMHTGGSAASSHSMRTSDVIGAKKAPSTSQCRYTTG
jgi:hypothetical protein